MDELPAKEMVKGNDNLEILDGEVFTDKYAFAFKKGCLLYTSRCV